MIKVIQCTTLSQVRIILTTENYNSWRDSTLEDVQECIDEYKSVGIAIVNRGEYSSIEFYKLNPHIYNIIEFENSKYKENEMTKIDIRKNSYKDKNIEVYTNGSRTTVQLKYNSMYYSVMLTIGSDEGLLTIHQANTILAPFGYELYQSTDWSKVEVGTGVNVKIDHGNGTATGFKATFHSYIPQTNQIIVFNTNKVEVYNSSEVSLCY